ncbi:MAG: ThuA domain-containing protein [Planctomycetes bacterium]|nr:ThuA domain-containing protein [Planctomycetota bacterium]
MISLSRRLPALAATVIAVCASCSAPHQAAPEDSRWLVYPSGDGPGEGKRVVFVAGDEEYRSEESLPMLARLMSAHHGFECVVLFSQDPETGEIDPNHSSNIPGLHLIDEADLLVLLLRFRELPDQDMAKIMDHVEAGKPLIGMRTSTHAFNYKENKESPYAKWTWNSKSPAGGFGKAILGETWVAHHGHHGKEATRGVQNPEHADHPTLRGVKDVFGTTDVYAIRDLPANAQVLLNGSVLDGMTPDAQPVDGEKNNPMHPVAWLRQREVETESGVVSQRIFSTTMGAAPDFSSLDLRKLFFNAAFWTLEMEKQIPEAGLKADMIGTWSPTNFGFNSFRTGFHPADYRDGTPD